MNWKHLVFGLVAFGVSTFMQSYSGAYLQRYFYRYEADFQAAADAYIADQKYTGKVHWIWAKGPGEMADYLDFHVGDDYRQDYYKPRIVYVHTDNLRGVHLCSFDGKMIRKIKPRWYICEEDRF